VADELVDAAGAAVDVDSKQRCLLRLLDRVAGERHRLHRVSRHAAALAARLPVSLQLHGG
jgi:hypothetical protein